MPLFHEVKSLWHCWQAAAVAGQPIDAWDGLVLL
jgi:hypothetical protein